MKVCLINNLYKPYIRGGAEVIVELIAQGLLSKNIEVVVISTRPFFSNVVIKNDLYVKNYYLPSNYYNLGKMPTFFRLFWHFFDLFNFFICNKIKDILIKEQPEIVITHNLKGLSFLLPRAIRKLKIKHLHYIHDIQLIHPSGLMIYGQEQQNEKFFAKIYQVICCKLFGSPDVIISPSKWLLDYHLQKKFFINSKKIVLANPAPILTSNLSDKEFIKDNIFRFLYVGQIEDHKGIIFLVDAFKELIKKNKQNIKLTIIGDGSKLVVIKKIADNKYVNILGKIKREEIFKYFAQANCLIVPSLCYENSPTVIYEAFSIGLPIIASKIGGIT
ncbi:MAG: glycosyltransferase, partial [bacterium]|nr:glycosyltransferase [bacterium]